MTTYTFAFPEETKAQIDAIRTAVGRLVTINVVEGNVACTGCSLDPITNTSTNSFCIVCDGLYWTPLVSSYVVSGHVRWTNIDEPLYTPGGIIPEGDCKVTVEYTEENLDHVVRSRDWLVDEITVYMTTYQLRGIRGDSDIHGPNRIAVYLKEEERG